MDVWYGKKYDKTSTHFHNTYVYLVWLRIAKKRVFFQQSKSGGKKMKEEGGEKAYSNLFGFLIQYLQKNSIIFFFLWVRMAAKLQNSL